MTFPDFAVSLLLTLLLEGMIALLWKFRGKDLLLFVLVNVLTNPAAVLLHALFPGAAVMLAIELCVVPVEGFCYAKLGKQILLPWLFSLVANAFSFLIGLGIDRFI